MKNLTGVLSRYSKFCAAIIGAITEALNIGLLPHSTQNYVSIAVTILTALGVVGVTNGPSPDVVGLVTDVAAIKDQILPLQKAGGIGGFTKWLADLVEQHGKNIEAIAVNAEEHVRALVHSPVVTVGSPSPNQPVSGQDATLKPVAEPTFDPPPTVPEVDHLAALQGMLTP